MYDRNMQTTRYSSKAQKILSVVGIFNVRFNSIFTIELMFRYKLNTNSNNHGSLYVVNDFRVADIKKSSQG